MAPSSMKESLIAMRFMPSTRNQHGCPRRVTDWSIMSSETRKNAWSCEDAAVGQHLRLRSWREYGVGASGEVFVSR